MKSLLASLLFLATLTAFADERFADTVCEEVKPDIVKDSGDYRYKLFYLNKGTRSEHVYGVLIFKGLQVSGRSKGEIKETPWGEYIWHGALETSAPSWGTSGWLPKRLSTIYPSWIIKKTEQGAAANP